MSKEFCICAAVKTACGQVIRGHRHHDCLRAIWERGLKSAGPHSQGFVTSTGRFVSRAMGLRLQKAARLPSQDPSARYRQKHLYSEDLYLGKVGTFPGERGHPLTPKQFKYVYSRVTRLCVDAIVIGPDGGVLLTKRTLPSWRGCWHLPGGAVLYREDPETALRRVLEWEIGYRYVGIQQELGHVFYPSEVEERGFGWSVAIVYVCTIQDYGVRELKVGPGASKLDIFTRLPRLMVEEQRDLLMRHRSTLRQYGAKFRLLPGHRA